MADQGRVAEAIPILRRSVEILKPFGIPESADSATRWWLPESLWELGRLLRATGLPAEADLLDAKRRLLLKDVGARELAGLALRRTTRAAMIGYGKTSISPAASIVRDLDLDQAAEDLRMAVSLGFRDLDMLRADPDSWLLLSRADLRSLIDDLEFPEEPFVPQPQK